MVNESVAFVSDDESLASLTTSRPFGHGPVRAYDWLGHHAANRPNKEAVRAAGRPFSRE